MATFDFSAPFVAARIVLPSGDAFPLWTNVGGAETAIPTVPGTEDLQALAFVQEVQVELNLSGVPQLSVQLAPPFEDGMKFLDSPLADGRMRNVLEVQLGYAGGTGNSGAVLSPPYAAALVAPEVSIDTDIQISLKGRGRGSGAEQQSGRVVARDGERRDALIRRLAAGPGGQRRTLEVDFSAIQSGSRADQLLKEAATGFTQGARSDWYALWELAERTECVMLLLGPRERGGPAQLLWLPKRERTQGPPTRRYRLYHHPAGQFQGETVTAPEALQTAIEMPLLSFSCNTEAVWNALTYQDILNHGVRLDGVDPDTVEATTTPVTLEAQAMPVNSGEGVQTLEENEELALSEDEGRMPLPGNPEDSAAVSQAQSEVAAGADMGVQCQLEVLGDPTILPGDLVAVAGLGRRFDNRVYWVQTVTHAIGVSGFSTTLVVNSNVDPTGAAEGREPTGPANTADVEAAEGFTASAEVLSDNEFADLTGIAF